MSTGEPPAHLIVCSDSRADEIATVTSVAAVVYRRARIRGEWKFSLWGVDGWHTAENEIVPTKFSVLFFHTGQGDPAGIPESCSFATEFAFSAGGVGKTRPSLGHEDAIPIQRRFPKGGCPIKARHVSELTAFLNGERKEPPAFVRHDESVPAFWALAIACKAYATVGIAHGVIKRDDLLVTGIGWHGQEWEIISKVGTKLEYLWPQVQTTTWWRSHLGFIAEDGKSVDNAKYQEFLARLILDLEFDILFRTKLKLAGAEQIASASPDALLQFLDAEKTSAGVAGIITLLRSISVTQDVVAAAYKDVSALLAKR